MSEQLTPVCYQIMSWVKDTLASRDVGTANRASSAPGCVRKRWFQNQGIVGEPMQPRSALVFATGDVVEHVAKFFIHKACVGPDKFYSEVDFGKPIGTFTIQHREFTTYKQDELEIDAGGVKVTGHPDGWGKRNSDGEWELIEIKSASSYSFDDFVDGSTDYVNQLHALMMSHKGRALNVKSARLFYMNKNTSNIYDRLYEYDEIVARQVVKEFQQAASNREPEIPKHPNIGIQDELFRGKPTGKLKLGWKCAYCDYKMRCFPTLKLEFKNGKPVYYLKE